MKPSDIALDGFPPLLGTFGRVESEVTAAAMVRTLQVRGDEWRPLGWSEVVETIGAELESRVEPWVSILSNPFLRNKFSLPDLLRPKNDEDGGEYIAAEEVKVHESSLPLVAFTQAGIERMAAKHPKTAGSPRRDVESGS